MSSGKQLRLHLNENTGGCSPAVVNALRSITCEQTAFYPDVAEATGACARHLGVTEEQVLLTNGLDEGILAASMAALRGSSAPDPYEAIVIAPAFDMYAFCANAAGGRVVEIEHGPEFAFPLNEVLSAINSRTRLVFLTNPNNPTGLSIPRDAILAIARAASGALVFLDEAYTDFSGTSLIADADLLERRNVLIGRTFAKAYGLAALRVGAVIAPRETLQRIRDVVPPYNLNVAAAIALPAALADQEHYLAYLSQTAESKRLLYAAFDRLSVKHWKSDANFVLAWFGDDAGAVVKGLSRHGVFVRDRSTEGACRGCVRITAGIVEHTRACIAAIEEVLCAGR